MDTTLRPLPGFSSYGVTEEGAVVNIHTGYSLKPFKRGKNYSYVRLYTGKGSESIERSVAACIWAAHHRRWPSKGQYVCHADGFLENNHIDNLYLGTRAEVARTSARRSATIYQRYQKRARNE